MKGTLGRQVIQSRVSQTQVSWVSQNQASRVKVASLDFLGQTHMEDCHRNQQELCQGEVWERCFQKDYQEEAGQSQCHLLLEGRKGYQGKDLQVQAGLEPCQNREQVQE